MTLTSCRRLLLLVNHKKHARLEPPQNSQLCIVGRVWEGAGERELAADLAPINRGHSEGRRFARSVGRCICMSPSFAPRTFAALSPNPRCSGASQPSPIRRRTPAAACCRAPTTTASGGGAACQNAPFSPTCANLGAPCILQRLSRGQGAHCKGLRRAADAAVAPPLSPLLLNRQPSTAPSPAAALQAEGPALVPLYDATQDFAVQGVSQAVDASAGFLMRLRVGRPIVCGCCRLALSVDDCCRSSDGSLHPPGLLVCSPA